MTELNTLSENISFGGTQGVYQHQSSATGTPMTFSVYVPPHTDGAVLPVVWYLSGLTCTHANVTDKGEYRKICAELGMIFVAPDTSPRGEDVPNDDAYDFGQGAGFYVDATQAPWDKNYQMRHYIEQELPSIIARHFPVDMARQAIMGHSMGGHGALTIGLRNPQIYRSISAFAPICSPLQCPWGEKALSGYLGDNRAAWREYDACALIEDLAGDNAATKPDALLIDQGAADQFLVEQLKPELIEAACNDAGIALTLNRRDGYDHSYYFIASFMEDHLRWHAAQI